MLNSMNPWHGDWRARVRRTIHEVGCETLAEYLAKHPAEPFISVARRLGEDVAAIQLEHMQLDEARQQGQLRFAAMDSLARQIRRFLPNGWGISDRLQLPILGT